MPQVHWPGEKKEHPSCQRRATQGGRASGGQCSSLKLQSCDLGLGLRPPQDQKCSNDILIQVGFPRIRAKLDGSYQNYAKSSFLKLSSSLPSIMHISCSPRSKERWVFECSATSPGVTWGIPPCHPRSSSSPSRAVTSL